MKIRNSFQFITKRFVLQAFCDDIVVVAAAWFDEEERNR